MSSNRTALVTRALMAFCLAAALAGCATDDKLAKKDPPPLTPTEQFPIKVIQHPDQILLDPHPEGLSPAQSDALQALADRWRDNSDGMIDIQTPAHGGEDAYRATAAVQEALAALGVRPDQIEVSDYDAGLRPHAPIVVGYKHYEARGPQCGINISNFTSSSENKVNSNFGCAVTANIAAMIADPADLMDPRHVDPADSGRRITVLSKYRSGEVTSSIKDQQASGAVSNVGQ